MQTNWETMDVESLDVEDALTRFKNLTTRNLKPRTISDYETRFRRAVGSYREYLVNPGSWKFLTRPPTSPRSSRPARSRPSDESSQPLEKASTSPAAPPGVATQEYTYPFRQDVLAKLAIPRDATAAEISRLVAWARTLAIDYEPSS